MLAGMVDEQFQALAERLASAAGRLSVRVRPAMARLGLSLPQARVLASLEGNGPQRVTELAAGELVAQPTMSAVVAGLVRQGWVKRRPDASDRRAVRLHLTQAGREVLRAARTARGEALGPHIAALGEEERKALLLALPVIERLIEHF
jgi:DNA-binding MarR family transcriptional regulator